MRQNKLGPPRRKDTGQATIMVSIGMVFLMAILGLVVDVGYGYFIKQCAQTAADSAAVAAALAAQSSGGVCSTTVLCPMQETKRRPSRGARTEPHQRVRRVERRAQASQGNCASSRKLAWWAVSEGGAGS